MSPLPMDLGARRRVLAMTKAADNDKEGAMECISNMVDVLVRYPGLNRCRMG